MRLNRGRRFDGWAHPRRLANPSRGGNIFCMDCLQSQSVRHPQAVLAPFSASPNDMIAFLQAMERNIDPPLVKSRMVAAQQPPG